MFSKRPSVFNAPVSHLASFSVYFITQLGLQSALCAFYCHNLTIHAGLRFCISSLH